MYTRSTTRVRTVANRSKNSRPVSRAQVREVALYTSAELDALTEQLDAIERDEQRWTQQALFEIEALASTLDDVQARLHTVAESLRASLQAPWLARPSRAQWRVLVRLATVDGQELDPRDEDDSAWCDGAVLGAMLRRRWIACDALTGRWRLTAYGAHAYKRGVLARAEHDAVQLSLIPGGAR